MCKYFCNRANLGEINLEPTAGTPLECAERGRGSEAPRKNSEKMGD